KYWKHGMNTVPNVTEPRLLKMKLLPTIVDGRTISVPIIGSWHLGCWIYVGSERSFIHQCHYY
ncbi:MAG: hypothetical protein ACXW03_07730, partial [Methylobacter sp.]